MFHADLHIHSRHSRATSRDCDLEHLAFWAGRKGIQLLGTGDFTHPAWMEELKEKLRPDGQSGLFTLRSDLQRAVQALPGARSGPPTRFMLQVEISTIYKQDSRTRKVHHLLYVPDLQTAERLSTRLGRIGNLAADGRPILGLSSRDLLEIMLESGPGAYLIPAHIWTPWFAALGSRSGFESIAECYGDLAGQVFALETGLSSDPPMNRRLSALDRFTLVSNSDAHSPSRIGREATAFGCELDYWAIRRVLETGRDFRGTLEFFAEEGKYHLDGHRVCGVRMRPEETRACGGRCPVCGLSMTVGVLHRVDELADRAVAPPGPYAPYSCLIPLEEILGELLGLGPRSKGVRARYEALLGGLGPELGILTDCPLEDIQRAGGAQMAEGIGRMRAGQVVREPGYDGEYGRIGLFRTSGRRAHGSSRPDSSP